MTPRPLATSPGPAARSVGIYLAALTLVAGALRSYRIGSNSLWVDEFATLHIVSAPFAEILRTTAEVNFCPPLYFWLVHGIVTALGTSESTLRLLSAVAGTLTIPVTWWLARDLTSSRRIASLAALFLALNPLHLWYSQEARPYALLVLLGTSALLALHHALRTGAWSAWIAFVFCTALTVLSQTIGLIILGVAWAWVLLARPRLGTLGRLAGATAAALALCAPFGVVVAEALSSATGTHSPPRPFTGLELPYSLFTYLGGYSFGPSLREIQNLGPVAAMARHPLETSLCAAAVVALSMLVAVRRWPGRPEAILLMGVPLVVLLAAAAASGKAYNVRYTLVSLVGVLVLAAGAVQQLPSRPRAGANAALLTLFVWADLQWYFTPVFWKDDSRAAVHWLATRTPPGAKVVVAPGYSAPLLTYYAELSHEDLRFVPVDSGAATPRAAALLLTRLHHVEDWRWLEAEFLKDHPAAVRDSVGGYYALVVGGGAPGTKP